MKKISWLLLYNILIIPLYYVLIYLVGIFHKKIRKGLIQRFGLFSRLKRNINNLQKEIHPSEKSMENKKRLWFHVSSVGEFIMAQPIIEHFYKMNNSLIMLTFFSPSGYEWAKKYKFAHIIDYYPVDSAWNVLRLLKLFKPSSLFIVKTDIWPNMIWLSAYKKSQEKKIHTYMISATLPETSSKGKSFLSRSFYNSILNDIKIIFAVHKNDQKRFQEISPKHKNIILMGDTKIDAVLEKVENDKQKNLSNEMKAIRKNFDKIIIAGSCWQADEEILISQYKNIQQDVKRRMLLILVPHEPNEENLNRCKKRLEQEELTYSLLSSLNNKKNKFFHEKQSVLIVDKIGILAELYRIGDIAFVGTGRGGVHNVLEPLAWNIPVLFRTKYQNAHEAIELVNLKLAFASEDSNLIKDEITSLLANKQKYNKLISKTKKFLTTSKGATNRCLKILHVETKS